ncbi:DUF4055 domain-containing protein [Pseudomonas grimontii]|uniref:DUF4055 domain-containing protein n=1 Tax=Pseudomonas grimontii TaxID=129847 RepID=UPI00216993C2|nr:DUF4055 domain-containing protein [Pseudomonas grimontii]MCS3510056.1 hypothetical protein [Pseudomonas grimontii]
MSVEVRTARCQKFYSERQTIRDVRGGADVISKLGVKYLPLEPREHPDDYKRRLARSLFMNFTEEMVQDLASKPFVRPIVIKSENHQEIANAVTKKVDGRGTSINGLCSAVFEDAIWNGTSFFAVDCAINGGMPYIYHLSADKILGFKLDEDDRLTEIRISETAVVPDGEWGEKEVERVRVFRRNGEIVTWSLWENGSNGYVQIVVDEPFALKVIPVFPVHSSAVVPSGELFVPSLVKDLVRENLEHYRKLSDYSNILHTTSCPSLFITGVDGDEQVIIGAAGAVKGPIGATMAYVESNGSATGAGREAIEDLVRKMRSRGAGLLENKGPTETATGRVLQVGQTNNKVAIIAMNMAAALEPCLAGYAYFLKVSSPDFMVDINTDYGITSNPEELTALANARTMGDLSREDHLQELKRRGILRNEFSLADNEDRLSIELA